jgi:hypothetical protein
MNKVYRNMLKSMVKQRRLRPIERIANRLGYMGTGLFLCAPHMLPDTAGIVAYIFAGLFSMPQVWVAKQWNIVAVNINVIIAYSLLFVK